MITAPNTLLPIQQALIATLRPALPQPSGQLAGQLDLPGEAPSEVESELLKNAQPKREAVSKFALIQAQLADLESAPALEEAPDLRKLQSAGSETEKEPNTRGRDAILNPRPLESAALKSQLPEDDEPKDAPNEHEASDLRAFNTPPPIEREIPPPQTALVLQRLNSTPEKDQPEQAEMSRRPTRFASEAVPITQLVNGNIVPSGNAVPDPNAASPLPHLPEAERLDMRSQEVGEPKDITLPNRLTADTGEVGDNRAAKTDMPARIAMASKSASREAKQGVSEINQTAPSQPEQETDISASKPRIPAIEPKALRADANRLTAQRLPSKAAEPQSLKPASVTHAKINRPIGEVRTAPMDASGGDQTQLTNRELETLSPRARLADPAALLDPDAPSPDPLAEMTSTSGKSAAMANYFQQSITTTAAPAQPSASSAAPNTPMPNIGGDKAIEPHLDQAIDQLTQARESARNSRSDLTVRHAEFGAVNMRLEASGSDVRALLSNRDPGFVPAIHAALADRAIGAVTETSTQMGGQSGSRGSDGNGANSSTGGQYAGNGAFGANSEARYGSSRGGTGNPSQPSLEHLEADRQGSLSRGPDEGTTTPSPMQRGSDLFA